LKAVRFHEFGGTEKLQYEDAADPVIAENEALVSVKACALNHLDLWARKGTRSQRIPMPHISGSDIAGTITQAGKLVSGHSEGEKVLVSPGLRCGTCQFCTTGRDSLCESYKIIGYETQGGYAEYVAVPGENLIPIPGKLSMQEASSVPLVFLTAWHMLKTLAKLSPGENVLIWAGGSGVGSAAIQISKLLGATAIATVGSDTKIELAQKLGADYVVNHHTQDVPEEVKRFTNGQKVNVVFDHVGQTTWDRSMRSMAPGGRLVNCGVTSGGNAQLDIRYVFARQLSLMGSYMGGLGELREVLRFFEDGRLRPVVDSVFPLQEAARAQEKMEKSQHFGKIVLAV